MYLRAEAVDGHDGYAVRISIHQSQRWQFQVVPQSAYKATGIHVRITFALIDKHFVIQSNWDCYFLP